MDNSNLAICTSGKLILVQLNLDTMNLDIYRFLLHDKHFTIISYVNMGALAKPIKRCHAMIRENIVLLEEYHLFVE